MISKYMREGADVRASSGRKLEVPCTAESSLPQQRPADPEGYYCHVDTPPV